MDAMEKFEEKRKRNMAILQNQVERQDEKKRGGNRDKPGPRPNYQMRPPFRDPDGTLSYLKRAEEMSKKELIEEIPKAFLSLVYASLKLVRDRLDSTSDSRRISGANFMVNKLLDEKFLKIILSMDMRKDIPKKGEKVEVEFK